MIRKFLPSVVLVVGAWLCVLACVGALAAACAIALSSLWGPVWGCLATAGLFAALCLVLLLAARLLAPKVEPPGAHLAEHAEDFFRAHPLGLMAATALGVFVLARKPAVVARAGAAIARSTAFIMMLKRLGRTPRR